MADLRSDQTEKTTSSRCVGLNYMLSMGDAQLTVGRFLPPGRGVPIPIQDIASVRLESKSVFPPLSIVLFCAIVGLSIWGFAAGWSWPIRLPRGYESYLSWSSLIMFAGSVDAVFRFAFVSLRIDFKDSRSIIVRATRRASAFQFVQQFNRLSRKRNHDLKR